MIFCDNAGKKGKNLVIALPILIANKQVARYYTRREGTDPRVVS
jgi:hypothetical protein